MKNCTHVNTLLLVSPAFRRQYLNRSLSCTAKVFMASLLDIKGTISVPITPVLDGQTWVDHSGNIHLISKEIIDALKLERQTPAGKEVMQHAS